MDFDHRLSSAGDLPHHDYEAEGRGLNPFRSGCRTDEVAERSSRVVRRMSQCLRHAVAQASPNSDGCGPRFEPREQRVAVQAVVKRRVARRRLQNVSTTQVDSRGPAKIPEEDPNALTRRESNP